MKVSCQANDYLHKHIQYSLPSIIDDNYEGSHWLGSFAIYALNSTSKDENNFMFESTKNY